MTLLSSKSTLLDIRKIYYTCILLRSGIWWLRFGENVGHALLLQVYRSCHPWTLCCPHSVIPRPVQMEPPKWFTWLYAIFSPFPLSLLGRTKNSFRRNLASFEHLQESFLSSRLQGMYGRKLGKIGVHIKCQQDHGELWTRERKETWCVANHTYVNFSIIHDQRSICGPMQRRGLS